MPKNPAGARTAKTEDAATGDVNRGVLQPLPASVLTEDQKRLMGVDASQAEGAGDHDYSNEANVGQVDGGSSLDTYAGGPIADHDNAGNDGRMQPLVVGQAAVAPAFPVLGSQNSGEKYDPGVPNGINRSPVIRGVEKDPRNDPSHPEHASADRRHPDYGKAAGQHMGVRTTAPSFNDLKNDRADAAARSADRPETEAA